jgi:hypothetical protein
VKRIAEEVIRAEDARAFRSIKTKARREAGPLKLVLLSGLEPPTY